MGLISVVLLETIKGQLVNGIHLAVLRQLPKEFKKVWSGLTLHFL